MFAGNMTIIDEILTPGIKLRFAETEKKKHVILSYNDMTDTWNVMHQYGDMFAEWKRWEKTLAPIRNS